MKNCSNYFLQLNKISNENFISIGNINFYYGEYTCKLKEVLKKIIPFGKTLLLISEERLENEGNNIIEQLKAQEIKVVLLEEYEKSFEEITKEIEDDVRAVVAIGNEFFDFANKLATKLNLFFICVVDSFNFSNLLNYSMVEKRNGEKQSFVFDADTHVIFDIDKILCDSSNAYYEYAFIMSNLISLIDYRIYGLATNSPTNKNAYGLVKEAVEETYSLFSYPREEYLLLIIKNSIKIRLANIISRDRLFSNSSVGIVTRLKKEKDSIIPICNRVIELYTLCFSGNFDKVGIPDYLIRAEKVLNLDIASEKQVGRWLVSQSKIMAEKKEIIKVIKSSLKAEIFEYNNIYKKVKKTYLALGGKLGECDDEILKYCGDFYQAFNGMTLVRESGITEFL